MRAKAIKGIGIAFALFGAALSGYAQFVFDPSLSPVDTMPDYGTPTSISDQAAAVRDLADRYDRAMAGERTINVGRLAEQQRMFYFGLLLILLGAGAFAFGAQRARTEVDHDGEEYL